MRRLSVTHALLYFFNLVFNVAVRDENIGPAIVVVIEEEAAEAERYQRGTTDFGAGCFVHKQAVAFVVIKREHLIGKVSNDQACTAGAVVVGSINAHAGASDTIFAEGDASGNSFFFKGSIVFVQIELVGLGIVGEHDVGPAVAVVIENGDAKSLRSVVKKVSFLSGVFKLSVAEIVPQPCRRTLVRFRRAIRFVGAVKRTEQVSRKR